MNCRAFLGQRSIASGTLEEVARTVKSHLDQGAGGTLLIFDDATGNLVDIDFRGTLADVEQRLMPPVQPKPVGRPKLGVVGREVTLLPRHWDWLSSQPGGASVALRKLVDEARKTHDHKDRVRESQQAAFRFMNAIAGNETGFEEALRALFAGDRDNFVSRTANWPSDIREHAARLADFSLRP